MEGSPIAIEAPRGPNPKKVVTVVAPLDSSILADTSFVRKGRNRRASTPKPPKANAKQPKATDKQPKPDATTWWGRAVG